MCRFEIQSCLRPLRELSVVIAGDATPLPKNCKILQRTIMAQRTADSLFESGTDDANFFMVEDAGLSANGESNEVLEKAQINVEEVVSTPSNDPYGQVQASSYEQAVKSDPYASQDRYAPIKSSTPLQGYNNSPTPPTQYTPTHTYYNSPTPVYDPYAPTNGRSVYNSLHLILVY